MFVVVGSNCRCSAKKTKKKRLMGDFDGAAALLRVPGRCAEMGNFKKHAQFSQNLRTCKATWRWRVSLKYCYQSRGSSPASFSCTRFSRYYDPFRRSQCNTITMSCKQLPIHTRAVARFSLCAEIDILVSVEKGWGCRNEMLTLFEFRKMRRSEDSEISLNPVAPSRRHEVKVHQWTFARIWGGWPTYISWASQHQRCWRRLATVHVRVGGTIDALQRALGWGWRGVGLFDKISQPGSSNRHVANVGWATRWGDVWGFGGLPTSAQP